MPRQLVLRIDRMPYTPNTHSFWISVFFFSYLENSFACAAWSVCAYLRVSQLLLATQRQKRRTRRTMKTRGTYEVDLHPNGAGIGGTAGIL